ncbi:MAG: hypothetical protein ABIJ21_04015 [Nanoarchaeota archaeon]
MLNIGRVCVKIAGRDAGKTCAIIDTYDNGLVLIDGETRRRKCNIRHLLPKEETISLKKDASHDDVISAFKKIGITIAPRKEKTPEKKEAQAKIVKETVVPKEKTPIPSTPTKGTAPKKTPAKIPKQPKKPAKTTKKTSAKA